MVRHLISSMVLVPFAGAVLQALLPQAKGVPAGKLGRWIALATSLASSLCGIVLVASMGSQTAELQGTEVFTWIGSYAIHYEMGVDGLNALLILLLSILFPILIAAEWNRTLAPRGILGLFLLLQSSFFGAVCAQDMFLQFFFWGFSALPFYFLIGIWGGINRESASFRSIVTASVGNALVFFALILVYYSVDPHTFSLRELAGGRLQGKMIEVFGNSFSVSGVAFALISLGLALRVPVWPLHGWFTHVAEEAPPSVLVAISGITVPVASYLFVRLTYSLFPETLVEMSPLVVLVGAVNLLMGGICAVAQRGLRTLLAFVCLGQVGVSLLGIGSLSSAGLVGALYHQLVVGLALAGLGLVAGVIIDRAGHASFLSDSGEKSFGGVATRAPSVAMVAGIVLASLLGFPGSGGFVAQSLVVIGGYDVHPLTVAVMGGALLLAAFYFLTMYRQVFLGEPGSSTPGFSDLTLRERTYMMPLVLSLLILGVYPKPLLDLVRPTAVTLLSTVK